MAATLAQLDTAYGSADANPDAGQHNEYGSGDSAQSKSPLSAFQFLKGLGPEKKVKADGQPPKRRGPKPDSKPALTRRQELNRQAQRTHRERKELYIKALESEVLHLKDLFASTTLERDNLFKENQRLREILAQHGIQVPPMSFSPSSATGLQSTGTSGPAGSSAPTSFTQSPPPNLSAGFATGTEVSHPSIPIPAAEPVDYEQVGIDFVLAYDDRQRSYLTPPPEQ